MEEHDEMIDQTPIAESLSKKIPYEFRQQFLVKPLEPVMVKKEFDVPIGDTPKSDENGVVASDYKDVKTEIKEVESDYKQGIVLKLPFEYIAQKNDEKYPTMDIKIGDILIYKKYGRANYFDLLKDTELVSMYDIIAIKNGN